MKRILSFCFCLVFLFSVFGITDANAFGTSAEAHILLDADTGIILTGNNMNKKLKMASTTKIMTTLIALEYAAKSNRVVTFTEKMAAEGSSMYLEAGDRLRLTDLAAGMMMASGNDAANAVALSIAGSMEDFALMMNKRAKELGMNNTNFVTPSGLDDPEHYSTAYDMALLMAEAMNNQSFLSITSSGKITVEFDYPEDKVRTYTNHNRLLKLYKHCTGGKTGFTKAAGRCLVTSAEYNGVRLIAVTLNAPDDWNDHKALYEYGFSLYTDVSFVESANEFSVAVAGGAEGVVTATVDQSVTLRVPADRTKDIKREVFLPEFVFAPVSKGSTLGEITYTLDGKLISKAFIKADCDVSEKPQPNFFRRLITRLFNRE